MQVLISYSNDACKYHSVTQYFRSRKLDFGINFLSHGSLKPAHPSPSTHSPVSQDSKQMLQTHKESLFLTMPTDLVTAQKGLLIELQRSKVNGWDWGNHGCFLAQNKKNMESISKAFS